MSRRALAMLFLLTAGLQAGPMRLAGRTAKAAPMATVHYVAGVAKGVFGLVKAVVW